MDDTINSAVTWAEIDLDALTHNVSAFRDYVGDRVKLIAVIKANAYGHGAVMIARSALEAGASSLAVHRLSEGIELRQAGILAPILLMGYTPPAGAGLVTEWRLTPSLITLEFARALSAHSTKIGIDTPVHVKVDSGMSRFGLMPEEVPQFVQALHHLPGIKFEGLFTHFATADWADQTYLRQQLDTFNQVIDSIWQAGYDIPTIHAANSAATLSLCETHFAAVRIGIGMYGLHPFPLTDHGEKVLPFEIHPVLMLKSTVCRVRELPAGAGVGYGRTFITDRPLRAALVPVGYGDGYHRSLSNKGSVLVRGQRAPIIGRVSMDQIIVDVSHIPQVRQDDEVVLIGRQGQELISAEELAALAGTINYEITTALLPRVPRVYFKSGRPVSVDAGYPYI